MIVSLAELRAEFVSPTPLHAEFDPTDPRSLTPLSLEQQKKRAKELLRTWRANDSAARARVHRSSAQGVHAKPRLNDAQGVIAAELGFPKWTDLKAHIELMTSARRALMRAEPSALDGQERTLHIRCGSDVMHKLAIAGFNGDFLSFADPYVQGPVTATDSLEHFIAQRAAFLASAGFISHEMALARLAQEYAALERAQEYSRVLLWLEHDSYDQLILAKLLHFFSDARRRPAQLRLLCVTHFPGVKRFNGIGQLPPEALRVLWGQFADVTPAQLSLGQQAWVAICASTPEGLRAIIAGGTPALPSLAPALQRHVQELPSVENGLSLTEHLTLQILADKGEMNAARLFGWYTNHYEPLPFLGDSGYWYVLTGLAQGPHPALHLNKQGSQPKDWRVALTPIGEQLLKQRADWLALNSVQRWLGGLLIDGQAACTWRYDQERGVVLHRRTP